MNYQRRFFNKSVFNAPAEAVLLTMVIVFYFFAGESFGYCQEKDIDISAHVNSAKNITDVTFTEMTGISLPGVYYSSVAWGDYDNDGDLDILLTGYSTSELISKIYRNNGNGSFSENTSASLPGVYYSSVAWGDYDNDGDLDILLTGYTGSEGISKIYRNNGNGSFSENTSASLPGVYYSSVAWADYDNDGDLDILLTGYSTSGEISKIYRNNGNGSFSENTFASLPGVYYSSVAWGDYDNDGYPDILLTGNSTSGNISKIYRNNGNGSFSENTSASLPGVNTSSVAWGDYDNDGYLDILLTGYTYTGGISNIYRNTGNGSFSVSASLPGVSNSSVAWGDYDNDGYLDILLTGYSTSGHISKIYKNNNGSFSENTASSLPDVGYSSVAWGDYDNDGDLDILLTGSSTSGMISKIYRNNSTVANSMPGTPTALTTTLNLRNITLSWSPASDAQTPVSSLTYNVRIGTSPGGFDIVSPHALGNGKPTVPGMGNVQLGTTFTVNNLLMGKYYWSVQAVDNGYSAGSFAVDSSFTLSNAPPYVSVNQADSIAITLAKLSGTVNANNANTTVTFEWGKTESYGNSVSASPVSVSGALPVEVVDTIADLEPGTTYHYRIKAENSLGITYSPNMTLTTLPLFVDSGITLEGVSMGSAAWGDYDNDGYLDILLTGYYTYTERISNIYRNIGNGSFTENTSTTLLGVYNSSVAWGDYDNDGDLDILLTGYTGFERISKIYRNNGNGSFSENTSASLPGVDEGSVAWADYDNDGYMDILLTGYTGSEIISKIYRNNGNGSFSENTSASLPGVYYSSVAWGDYDNDGDLDILLTGYSTSGYISKIYRNNGNGSFSENTSASLPGVYYSSVAWGDYDNDGYLDILLTGYTTSGVISKIYRNNGNGSFSENTSASLPGVYYSSVAWGDYDNDGELDILLTGYLSGGGTIVEIYRNNGDDTFTLIQPDVPLPGVSNSSVAWGDYDNDGDLDILLTGRSSSGLLDISKVFKNNGTVANSVPVKPVDLVSIVSLRKVTLSWTPASDAQTPAGSLTYNVRTGTSPGGSEIVSPFSLASGKLTVPAMGNAQLDSVFYLNDLSFGSYYWSVQAVDNGYSGGPFTEEKTFKIGPEVITGHAVIDSLSNVTLNGTVDPAGFTADSIYFSYGLTDTTMNKVVKIDQELNEDGGLQSVSANLTGPTQGSTYFYQLHFSVGVDIQSGIINSFNTSSPLILSYDADTITVTGARLIAVVNPNGSSTTVAFEYGPGSALGQTAAASPSGITGTTGRQVSATIGSLTKNTTYYYRVKATNSSGTNYSSIGQFITDCDDNILCTNPSGVTSVCQGTAESTYTTASSTALSYVWELIPSTAGTISWSGSTGTVNWNNSFSGAASIRVSGINGTCNSVWTDYLNVTVKETTSPVVISGDESVCRDQDNSIYKIVPEDGITYNWSVSGGTINSGQGTGELNVKWGSTSGNGMVSLTQTLNSTGCSHTDSVSVNIESNPPPTVPAVREKGNINILICTESEMEGYQWYRNDIPVSGATGQYYVARNNSGTYKVVITDSNGCYSQSADISVGAVSGTLNVWPNPAKSNLMLSFDFEETGIVLLKVVDTYGNLRQLHRFVKMSDIITEEISLGKLPGGVYVIEAEIEGIIIGSTRIVII